MPVDNTYVNTDVQNDIYIKDTTYVDANTSVDARTTLNLKPYIDARATIDARTSPRIIIQNRQPDAYWDGYDIFAGFMIMIVSFYLGLSTVKKQCR